MNARGLRKVSEQRMFDLNSLLALEQVVCNLEITREMVERRDLSLCLLEKAG